MTARMRRVEMVSRHVQRCRKGLLADVESLIQGTLAGTLNVVDSSNGLQLGRFIHCDDLK